MNCKCVSRMRTGFENRKVRRLLFSNGALENGPSNLERIGRQLSVHSCAGPAASGDVHRERKGARKASNQTSTPPSG